MTHLVDQTNDLIETKKNHLTLTPQERHDLKSALLSVRWAADLLSASDESDVPQELIAEQLYEAFRRLEPVIGQILNPKETLSHDDTFSS